LFFCDLKDEINSVDPKTGKTLREHLFGIEKEELKEESNGKEGKKRKRQNIYQMLFHEKKENTEEQRMESLKNIRHYFDMSAKIYGLLGAEVKRYFLKIGERVAQNQLALVAIDTLMQTRDKTSLKAMERILKDEEKYTEEHPGSPLAELFLKMRPEIDLLIKDSH